MNISILQGKDKISFYKTTTVHLPLNDKQDNFASIFFHTSLTEFPVFSNLRYPYQVQATTTMKINPPGAFSTDFSERDDCSSWDDNQQIRRTGRTNPSREKFKRTSYKLCWKTWNKAWREQWLRNTVTTSIRSAMNCAQKSLSFHLEAQRTHRSSAHVCFSGKVWRHPSRFPTRRCMLMIVNEFLFYKEYKFRE